MMKILLLVILLVSIPNAHSKHDCSNGNLNVKNRMEFSQEAEFGTYETFSGVLEICYNNSYSNVCLNTSDVNATEVARIACNYFGYYGKCLYLLINLSILFTIILQMQVMVLLLLDTEIIQT